MPKSSPLTLNDLIKAGVHPNRIKVNGAPITDQINDQSSDVIDMIRLQTDTINHIDQTNKDMASLIRQYDSRINHLIDQNKKLLIGLIITTLIAIGAYL